MTQAITPSQILLEKLHNLTPEEQQEVINFVEFLQFKAKNQETSQQKEDPISFYQAAHEYIGCVDGGPGDLATNKDYLKLFLHKDR